MVPDPPEGKSVYFPAGCLDGDPQVRPSLHIFTADKAPWYSIADDLPQHQAYPPDWSLGAVSPTRATGDPPDTAARADHSATGSCLCGRVAYSIAAGPALGIYYCHCSRCRKARGAAHGANVFVERDRSHGARRSEL